MRLLTLYARSRGATLLAPLIAVLVLWCAVVPIDLQDNPLDATASTALVTLTGLGCSLFVAMMFGNPMRQLERAAASSRLRQLRLVWLFGLILVLGLVGTTVLFIRGVNGWIAVMHWRNVIQGVALACLCACAIPRPAAWTVPAVALAACWLLGIKDLMGTPRLLAFPCYPPNSVASWLIAFIALAAAATVYVRRDASPET